MSATTVEAPPARPGGRVPEVRPPRERRHVWAYLLPVCVVSTLVFVVPLLFTIWTATHDTKYYEIGAFNGLSTISAMFADDRLLSQVLITLGFAGGALVIALPLGLLSAIALNRVRRLKRTVRSLFLLPWLMSQATAGTIWLWFLNPNFGPATDLTNRLGLGSTDVFSSPGPAFLAITLITAWWSYPQAMLLFLGALQTVPVELKESMQVDGGNAWQTFRNVTLPFIRNTVVSVAVVLLMLYVQMVTIILVTTRGGPLGGTETLAMRTYNQMFVGYDMSGAAASALLLFVINVVLTLVAVRFRRRETL
ncbi:sugar ABC transporter permease [Actinoplanes bogorensis]|uniref:Sugar ABC transporter permease n=1 Tax=Paractinoplanes bogorensis TaxID=1610840 RepID=A0ABS5Z3C2_9ACTN|nr:sugar ABC transporter permease [Actinoplanes bogorensis]MBU2670195.1 sugar ABC transporter permease [Actinoplanes bogorensis]